MRALIVDDEPMPAKHLLGMIEKHCFEIDHAHIINSPTKALEHLKSNQYDLLFLDVEMPQLDGFELLEEAQLTPSTQVIFTTAYSQYAVDAFKANATHYILKLVTQEELVKAVRKATLLLRNANNSIPKHSNDVITVFHGGEHHLLKSGDIIRLEADRSYTSIVTPKKTFLSSKGIGQYAKKLPDHVFFRCHHSHLVNLQEVVKMGKGKDGYLILSNNDMIPISLSKKRELEAKLRV